MWRGRPKTHFQMTMPPPHADAQLTFLRQVQRLLDEGSFVATYKYALLHAIADLCLIEGTDTGAALVLQTRQLAERFIELYWRQAALFPVPAGPVVLRQSTDRNASVIGQLEAARASHPTLARIRADRTTWAVLVGRVDRTIQRMPLWKLQTVGSGPMEFLYPNIGAGSSITLKPGVMFCMRAFHGLVTDLVRGAWVRHVRRYNAQVLGDGVDLVSFLFGDDRARLEVYAPILEGPQGGRCFYCSGRLRDEAVQVDHFIPWARYPLDLADNFVLAHSSCNNAKSDHLAAEPHLSHWVSFRRDHRLALAAAFDAAGVMHNAPASMRIAAWAYGQVEASRGDVWLLRKEFRALSASWRELLPPDARACSGRWPHGSRPGRRTRFLWGERLRRDGGVQRGRGRHGGRCVRRRIGSGVLVDDIKPMTT